MSSWSNANEAKHLLAVAITKELHGSSTFNDINFLAYDVHTANMKVFSSNLPSALRTSSGTGIMQRIILPAVPRTTRHIAVRCFTTGRRSLADAQDKGHQNSTPSWEGRHGGDHVLNRDAQDAQSAPSHEARAQKEKGEEGSSAISQKDENNSNKKAQEEHPESPMVIGMNSGRDFSLETNFGYANQLLQSEEERERDITEVSIWYRACTKATAFRWRRKTVIACKVRSMLQRR